MKIVEVIYGSAQQVTALQNQVKQAQKRAKEAALLLKLNQIQKKLSKAVTQPTA